MPSTFLIICGISVLVIAGIVIFLLMAGNSLDPENLADTPEDEVDEDGDWAIIDTPSIGIDNQGDPTLKLGGGLSLDLSDGSVGITVGGITIDTDGK